MQIINFVIWEMLLKKLVENGRHFLKNSKLH